MEYWNIGVVRRGLAAIRRTPFPLPLRRFVASSLRRSVASSNRRHSEHDSQVDEHDRQAVVADLQPAGAQVWSSIEDQQLHSQAPAPEGRDEAAHPARQRRARGQGRGVEDADRAEGNDHQHDEHAMHPDDVTGQFVQRRQLLLPVQDARHGGAGQEDAEVDQTADKNQCFKHCQAPVKAPIARMKGRITRVTNGTWNKSPRGRTVTAPANSRPEVRRRRPRRRPCRDRSNRTAAPWITK